MGAAQPNSADTTVLTTLDKAVSSTRGSRQHGDALLTQVTRADADTTNSGGEPSPHEDEPAV
jgi:hypothetical protein